MTRWDGVSDPRFDAYEGFGERDRRTRRADIRVDGKQTDTAAGGLGEQGEHCPFLHEAAHGALFLAFRDQ